jgi:hypothetical protein
MAKTIMYGPDGFEVAEHAPRNQSEAIAHIDPTGKCAKVTLKAQEIIGSVALYEVSSQ